MEAKDTLVRCEDTCPDANSISCFSCDYGAGYEEGAKDQVEISYKAGQDSVFDSMPENLPPLLETAHRSGGKEVVEWIRDNSVFDDTLEQFSIGYIRISGEKLQAKLKELGIEEVSMRK